jgi:uncharacterized membrane protein
MGTTAVCALVSILAISEWKLASAPYFLAGGLLYIVGTFMVTGMGNVPLNNRLAAARATDPAASGLWQHYLERWTLLNTLRTLCATAAAVMFIIGLLKSTRLG